MVGETAIAQRGYASAQCVVKPVGDPEDVVRVAECLTGDVMAVSSEPCEVDVRVDEARHARPPARVDDDGLSCWGRRRALADVLDPPIPYTDPAVELPTLTPAENSAGDDKLCYHL